MYMKNALRLAAICAVFTVATMTALAAANQPMLTIDSPENNATVQTTPGLGDVVVIKFRADNFKITGLNESMQNDRSAARPDAQPTSQSSIKSDDKPMSEKLPQTDQSAKGSDKSLPQSDQSAKVSEKSLPQSDQSTMGSLNAVADQGPIHVSVDRGKWYWVHSSNEPIILAGLPKGDHKVTLELFDANNKSTGVSQTVRFSVAK